MRITINYFEGYPELEAELAKYSPRARAERLRLLAAMGLSFMQDGRSHASTRNTTPVAEVAKTASVAPAPANSAGAGNEVARSITKGVFGQMD